MRTSKYEGKVVIQKEGSLYRFAWFIGRNQAQVGVSILENDILSVGNMDMSGRDFGVVSFKIESPTKIVGKWSSLGSRGTYGTEELSFESEKIPGDVKPLPPPDKRLSI